MNFMRFRRQTVPGLALVVLLLFSACGDDDENNANPFQPIQPATPVIALVANQASNNVTAYTINGGTGALVPVAGSPFPAGGTTPGGITVSAWVK